LESIDKKYSVIVVENSCDDHLKFKIESEYSNVKFILPKENLGYGAANNLGIKEAKTNYVLILNPDTILLKDTLEQLLSHANKIEDFAMLGPKIIDDNIAMDDRSLNDLENNKEKSVSCIK
jgi:GT2 family glycosyltransferase